MKTHLWIDVPSQPGIAPQCLLVDELIYALRNPDVTPKLGLDIEPQGIELHVRGVFQLSMEIARAAQDRHALRLGFIAEFSYDTAGLLLPRCELVAQKRCQVGCADLDLIFLVYDHSALFDIVNGVATCRERK